MTGFSTMRSQASEGFFEKRPIRGTQASKPHFNCSTGCELVTVDVSATVAFPTVQPSLSRRSRTPSRMWTHHLQCNRQLERKRG